MVKNGSNIEVWRGKSFIADSISAGGAPHGVAPRVYCAANPLRYVDPSGMRLIIRDDNKEAYEWMKIDDTCGFYNKAGELYNGTDNGMIQFTNALSQLMETETGRELVEDVVNLTQYITLKYDENHTDASPGRIRWSESQEAKTVPVNGSEGFNAVSNLGHELAHVKFTWTVEMNFGKVGTWFKLKPSNVKQLPRPVSKSDIYATHYENKIRSEMGLSLRTYYQYDHVEGSHYGSILDNEGRSLYFDRAGNYNTIDFKVIEDVQNRYKY